MRRRYKDTFVHRILPAVRTHAYMTFRGLNPEAREEAVAEAMASAYVAYLSLVRRGRAHLAFASTMARFAVNFVRNGRHVGGKDNCKELLNRPVERLDRFNHVEDEWMEVLVEDRTATPAEIAANRMDFMAWFNSLKRRDRRIAKALACGGTTCEVAKRFGISAGRVSQKRREFMDSWYSFVGIN